MTTLLSLLQPFAAAPAARREDTPADISAAHSLLDDARRDAAALRAEAAELLDDARIQSETLREAAWQEGFHNGQEAGRDAIELKLRAESQSERDALRAQVAHLVESFGAARQILWENQESEMVAFVLEIARKVIKTEITQNESVITNVLHNALRRVADKELVRIKVAPSDAERIREGRDDLLALLDGVKTLEIIDDRRITPGGCLIETNAGTIDAKIETQLAEIERAVAGE